MKELLLKEHPTHISPSNGRDKGRGFWPPFSSKRPPLPLGEHILAQVAKADKEKLPSNRALQRIARLVKGHPLAMLEASLAIGGGTYGVYTGVQYLNEINVNNPSPSSRSIDSFPNSFNDDRLVPRTEAETKKVNRDNAIKAKKFKIPPPNRIPSEDASPKYIPIDQLSTIKEHTAEYSRDGTYNNFQTGVGFTLEERSKSSSIYRRVTPNGLEPPVKTEYTVYARIGINGYTTGKEIRSDGNVFLAVYAPGKNGLPNQNNIENSLLSVENITEDGNEGRIYNAIVWLKAENFEGYSLPFVFNSVWNENSTNRYDESKKSNIPEELFRYIKVGDPVRASGAMLQIIPGIEDLLVENYQGRKNHLTYEDARKKYLNIVESNAETIQRMLEDTKTGGVGLKEQFETKRYVLQVSGVTFVPHD